MLNQWNIGGVCLLVCLFVRFSFVLFIIILVWLFIGQFHYFLSIRIEKKQGVFLLTFFWSTHRKFVFFRRLIRTTTWSATKNNKRNVFIKSLMDKWNNKTTNRHEEEEEEENHFEDNYLLTDAKPKEETILPWWWWWCWRVKECKKKKPQTFFIKH